MNGDVPASAYQPRPRRWIAADLAPGDGKSGHLSTSALWMDEVRSAAHPGFTGVYQALWQEFGARGELECEQVLARRLHWRLEPLKNGWMQRYEMVEVGDRGNGPVAVRDHSVIIPPAESTGGRPIAVVHLSHVLVTPAWRRSGIAGWMRAIPLQMARDCLCAMYGTDKDAAITLIAEMEPLADGAPERLLRLLAYERAGFRAVDSAAVPYFQPDFAPPEVIATRGKSIPLPLHLVVRRVGREQEESVDGSEVRMWVDALYRMYAEGCRTEDIAALAARVDATYPASGEAVALVAPTRVPA